MKEQCQAKTLTGRQCKRKARIGPYCNQHHYITANDPEENDVAGNTEKIGKPSQISSILVAVFVCSIAFGSLLFQLDEQLGYVIARIFLPILALISFPMVVDSLMKETPKKKIADYICGLPSVSFREFEYSTIASFIQIFLDRKGRLSFPKVYLYSFLGSVMLMTTFIGLRKHTDVFGQSTDVSMTNLQMIAAILFMALITSYLSVASDYMSLSITKFIFIREARNSSLLPAYILIDVILSISATLVPVLLIYGAVNSFAGTLVSEQQAIAASSPVLVSSTTAISLSLFVSVMYIVVMVFGVAIRSSVGFTLGYLKNLSRFLNVEKYPISILILASSLWLIPIRILQLIFELYPI